MDLEEGAASGDVERHWGAAASGRQVNASARFQIEMAVATRMLVPEPFV